MTDRVLTLFLKGLAGIFCFLPERIGLAIGSFLGGVAFVVCLPRTLIALRNLDRAMGRELGKKKVRRTIFGMYRNFGRSLVEFFRLPFLSPEKRAEKLPFQVSVEGIEYLKQAFASGRGVLVLTAHLGNWELMAAWMSLQEGVPVNILTKQIRQPVLNRWMFTMRHQLGIHSIYKKESIREIISKLKKNETVVFVLDQRVNQREGVRINFFDRPAWAISGLATLSIRYDVPVIPIFTFREGVRHHRIVIDRPIFPESTGNMKGDIQRYTQSYSDILERYVRAHPDQWIWIHKRWED